MSQPPEPPQPTFSHDLTLKSIFAEPRAAADLIAFLAERECPELRGWAPVRVVAGSSVTANPEAPPHQAEGHRDLVWLLARGDGSGDEMLLHLEFQSRPASDMSVRMYRYALTMSPSLRELEVCGVVVHTGTRPFGTWWSPVQGTAGVRRYGFREGALLDIHHYRVPGLPEGEHALPPDNLAAAVVALARVQAAMRRDRREAAARLLWVLRELLLPLVPELPETLRRALGAWFRTGFGALFADLPALRAALGRITHIEEAEAIMYTFGQYVEDEKKEAAAQGAAQGEAKGVVLGRKQLLLEYIRQAWGEAEAERCARELETTELDDLPDIAGLMADQAAGHRPRIQANGRSEPRS